MKVVCIGDSLTFGYGVKREESWTYLLQKTCKIDLLNKGINGDTMEGMVERFDSDVIQNKPSHVIIMGGSNDLIMDISLHKIQDHIMYMVKQAQENNIIPIIGVQPLTEPKMANRYWSSTTDFVKVNECIEQYRKWVLDFKNIRNIEVIDFCLEIKNVITELNKQEFYMDGVHLTLKGHEIMTNISTCKVNELNNFI